MITPEAKPPDEKPDSDMDLYGMRLWIFCTLLIVACGVANFLAVHFVNSP